MRQMSDGGNVVTLDLEGELDQAFRFLDALQLIDISNNLGDTKSLATHPATTTHQRLTPEERARLRVHRGAGSRSRQQHDHSDGMGRH